MKSPQQLPVRVGDWPNPVGFVDIGHLTEDGIKTRRPHVPDSPLSPVSQKRIRALHDMGYPHCSPVEALVSYTAPAAPRAAQSAARFGRAFGEALVLARTWLTRDQLPADVPEWATGAWVTLHGSGRQ